MAPPHESAFSEDMLVNYLLGTLPDEETESLDELSVADDELAARLNDVENDLVDAYVNRTLPDETAARFRSRYLSTARGLDKVRFAETWRTFHNRTTHTANTAADVRKSFVPPLALAATVLLAIATAYLLVQN